jgi:hypothetical protein
MRAGSRILLPVLLVLFVWAIVAIVMTPLSSGDAYPKYSSLRADPLGTKILYESLRETPGLHVERNFRMTDALRGKRAAIFLLGVSGPSWAFSNAAMVKDWEAIASNGSRLIFVFQPQLPGMLADFSAFEKKSEKQGKAKAKSAIVPTPPVQGRWGVKIELRRATVAERAKMERNPRDSALYFEADSSWKVIEKGEDGHSTWIEKPMGKGSIVLLAQGFALSNEGLHDEADAAQISALIGPYSSVVIDEFHLGIAETGSIGTLIRRYRLQGAVAVLLLLGMLFIWRNATSLLPPREAGPAGKGPVVLGRDAQQGMATLLQRSIPRDQLTQVAMQEWTRALPLRAALGQSRITAVQNAVAEASGPGSSAVDTYKKVHQILTERK